MAHEGTFDLRAPHLRPPAALSSQSLRAVDTSLPLHRQPKPAVHHASLAQSRLAWLAAAPSTSPHSERSRLFMTVRQTRAERAASPLARTAIRKIAEASGGCLRPVQLRRTDTQTGEMVSVMVPCRATLVSICPPCAERAKMLRAAQCREGWHLEHEPDLTPAAPDETQEFWLTMRAKAQLRRDTVAVRVEDTTDLYELIGELDVEVTRAGIRGTVTTARPTGMESGSRCR